MRIVNRTSAIIVAAALFLTLAVNSVLASKPTPVPAIYEGQRVTLAIVNENVVGVDQEGIASVAEPLYHFNGLQPHVIATMPGQPGYNPWWNVTFVTVLNGRNLTTDPFTSEAEILAAADAGEVALTPTSFNLLCQVVSK
jgi:hypothetical protein